MARETVKTARPLDGNILPQGLETTSPFLNDSFLVDFQEFSRNLHVFRAIDRNHELCCEMVLEVTENLISEEAEDGAYLASIVACSFPSINLQKLNEKIDFDSYLQGILMFQFQLKILEQLFLFCEQKDAVRLILTIPDANLDYLEIYSRFFVSQEQVITPRGERTRVVIPTDVHTYDEIVAFMDELDKDFRKILWRGQRASPAFRDYLKSNACL